MIDILGLSLSQVLVSNRLKIKEWNKLLGIYVGGGKSVLMFEVDPWENENRYERFL